MQQIESRTPLLVVAYCNMFFFFFFGIFLSRVRVIHKILKRRLSIYLSTVCCDNGSIVHRTKQNAQRGAPKRPIGSEAMADILQCVYMLSRDDYTPTTELLPSWLRQVHGGGLRCWHTGGAAAFYLLTPSIISMKRVPRPASQNSPHAPTSIISL